MLYLQVLLIIKVRTSKYSYMDNKTSNYPDHNMSESIKKEDKNMTCKDGYCFIPNSEVNQTISNENINIFDPL